MNRETNEHLDKEELEKHICELREVLNEICATAEDAEGLKQRLIVSQRMDRLIVQYMNKYNI
ncbi:hypothetical protein DIC82_10860 [Clostridium beijerinckii]|nr:hypothetical protein DIC82_10860 [Clostridium beijerinckii]